ncbi:Octicosapeptide/Phox/Bem1p (PB1) domain-containing protein [Abeliophyllum distichum]|uniref:Octicosapeptide/Phox/Bem1p (PB1) domain-containing protein n=1 Tax=Abeliophyllum distichum TaxID=126358 RepID=A0ABD1RUU8_9LAMI
MWQSATNSSPSKTPFAKILPMQKGRIVEKKEEVVKWCRKKLWEVSDEKVAEQVAPMRSQIHLFWGNMLFEKSQLERKLSLPIWKENLDSVVERFKLTGGSEADTLRILKNHCSNETGC